MMRFDCSGKDWRWVLPLVAICMVGCGGRDSDEPSATSDDVIAAFIEENPEFAAPAKPASGSNELGLDR
jgi:hypothetical protein